VSRRAPRGLGSALESLTARVAPAGLLAEVQRAWPDVVGPTIAAQATPSGERDGVLTVNCRASVWAQELDLLGPELVTGLNAALGDERIRVLRCVAVPPRDSG
jgi:predicted nucleic acid-binding Zn ribbon protein